MKKLIQLADQGQSIWLDYIHRSFARSGALQEMIAQGVRGVTSNPSIFEKAIAGNDDYDEEIQRLAAEGKSASEIYESIVIADIREAADLFRPLYDETDGLDGYVSLEVSPLLAHDTAGTIAEAIRLHAALARPNVLIKIPATPEGIPAIEAVIAEGISVNVTLIFSSAQYEASARAYIAGLKRRIQAGHELASIASVASVFISRVDTEVDAVLKRTGGLTDLRGHLAVDNARLIYFQFKEIFSGESWQKLAADGARVQRPLWASTGTKNPNYPDTLYVDALIGPDTVNTAPPETITAFADHGEVVRTIDLDMDGALERMAQLTDAGISFDHIMKKLLDDGTASFTQAFQKLMQSIELKRHALNQ